MLNKNPGPIQLYVTDIALENTSALQTASNQPQQMISDTYLGENTDWTAVIGAGVNPAVPALGNPNTQHIDYKVRILKATHSVEVVNCNTFSVDVETWWFKPTQDQAPTFTYNGTTYTPSGPLQPYSQLVESFASQGFLPTVPQGTTASLYGTGFNDAHPNFRRYYSGVRIARFKLEPGQRKRITKSWTPGIMDTQYYAYPTPNNVNADTPVYSRNFTRFMSFITRPQITAQTVTQNQVIVPVHRMMFQQHNRISWQWCDFACPTTTTHAWAGWNIPPSAYPGGTSMQRFQPANVVGAYVP